MSNFKATAAQGEVRITRVKSVPENAQVLAPVSGHYIIGHSETGHHHVIEAASGVKVLERTENGMKVFYAILDNPEVQLKHLRDFNTHVPIVHEPGVYRYAPLVMRDPYADKIERARD